MPARQVLYYSHRLIVHLFHIASIWKEALGRVLWHRGVHAIALIAGGRDSIQ